MLFQNEAANLTRSCACPASGHEAIAPPISVMNARRFIRSYGDCGSPIAPPTCPPSRWSAGRYGSKIALNSAARRNPALASWMRACALAQSSYAGSGVASQVHPPVKEKGEGFEPLRIVRRWCASTASGMISLAHCAAHVSPEPVVSQPAGVTSDCETFEPDCVRQIDHVLLKGRKLT
jgi:hypothetical protein